MKEWMAQANPPKESSTFERMNNWIQMLSSKKMTQYFKEWTTPISVLKKNAPIMFLFHVQNDVTEIVKSSFVIPSG